MRIISGKLKGKALSFLKSSKVLLDVEGDQNKGKTFFVNMNIDAFEAKWVFDSGAQLTSIGKRMFERLKQEGVTFKDLNLNIKTYYNNFSRVYVAPA